MKQQITLFCILLFFPMLLFSQAKKDFILNINRDTLFGKIKMSNKSGVLTFHHGRKKVTFHASTIDYFGKYRKGQYQVFKTLVNNRGEDIFVKVLSEGKVNLYYYDTADNELYTQADPFRYYIGTEEIYPIRMSPRSYNGLMKMMVKDQPNLLTQLAGYEDVPRIIKRYNKL